MPKVLHVFKIYYPEIFGGIQRAIYDIAEGTIEHGFQSTVFALSKEPNPVPFSVGNHKAITLHQQINPASTGMSFSAFAPFRRQAAEADIIHYHFPWPFMDVLSLVSGVKKPSLLTYHSDIVKQNKLLQLYKPLMHHFLGKMDRIIVASPNYMKTSPVLQHYQDKTALIPYGIRKNDIEPDQAKIAEWKSRLGEGFFLFLGALRYYKGLPTLLEAARITGLPVVIAGTGDQEAALKKNAPENVKFIGHYSDVDRVALLALAKAFVFPSHQRSEAFGISLLEAARASVPMICCEIGTGTTYVNQHEETGLVIPPSDPSALADAMRRLVNEPNTGKKFGQAARQRFEQLFTANQMAAAYADQYEMILTKSR